MARSSYIRPLTKDEKCVLIALRAYFHKKRELQHPCLCNDLDALEDLYPGLITCHGIEESFCVVFGEERVKSMDDGEVKRYINSLPLINSNH